MRRLLDAAVAVFAAKGFHAARVDDIVERAGTSHGTFYLYFANKDDLFRALTEDVADEMHSLVTSLDRLEPGDAGRQAIREWVARFDELYHHYGPVIRAWTEAETDDTEFGRLGNRLFGDLADALARRIEDSAVSGLDSNVASLAVLATVERFHYYAASGRLPVDRAEGLDGLAALLHDSLFGRQDSPPRRRSAKVAGGLPQT